MPNAYDTAVAELRRQYRAANAKASVTNVASSSWLGAAASLWGAGDSAAQNTASANLSKLSVQIDEWAGKLRRWAEAGRRDNGTAYTPAQWFQYGRELGNAVATQWGALFDASLFSAPANARAAAVATVRDVKAVATDVDTWPTLLKVGIGLAALAVLYPYLSPLLSRVVPKAA